MKPAIPSAADAAHTMRQIGGTFAHAIGDAWLRGDDAQKAELEAGMPHLFADFRRNAHILAICAEAKRQAAFDALVLQNEERN